MTMRLLNSHTKYENTSQILPKKCLRNKEEGIIHQWGSLGHQGYNLTDSILKYKSGIIKIGVNFVFSITICGV